MSVDVRYPAVLHTTHYRCIQWYGDDDCEPFPTLHRSRLAAEKEARATEWAYREGNHNGYLSVVIMPVEPVFLPRCGECAELPDDNPAVYADWWEMCQALDDFLGWVATSEQHVFCPNHRPDREE
ncbi:hypothetical protein ABT332_19605 [Saccharomonospora azurea]|uniref:hypothetical protein n=1 Tax=Saccharomonospora azurea TaxID=40988 RepID=UPI003320F79D